MITRRLASVIISIVAALSAFAISPVSTRVITHDIPGTLNNQCLTFYVPIDSTTIDVSLEARASLPHSREPIGESSRCWGIVFGDTLSVHYRVMMRRGNTDNSGFSNIPYIRLTVDECNGDNSVRLVDKQISEGISTRPDGPNSLQLRYHLDAGTADISLGYAELFPVASLRVEQGVDAGAWSISSDSWLDVERATSTITASTAHLYATPWTIDALDRHFATVTHPLEGYWRYLDIESGDDDLARAGGAYTLAVVSNPDGEFDILYIDGATVNAPEWHPCMLRGRLLNTRFEDHYDLHWTDASFLPINREASATLDKANGILSLSFPLYRTTLRFTRQ